MTPTTTQTENVEAAPLFPTHFTKMTGAGNDFILIDARENKFPDLDRASFTRHICRRSFGVGADGLIFIEKPTHSSADFKWDFYNADGSPAEMCGNAARCVARFAFEKKIAGIKASFDTGAGLVRTELLSNNEVKVEMPPPRIVGRHIEVPVGEHIKVEVTSVNTGVPHVVKLNDDWEDEYINDMGRYLRNHELFRKEGGANATFYEVTGASSIQSVTYERGVEAVTMACGTGAVAAAVVAVANGMKSPVQVSVPGGVLIVAIGDRFETAALTGEARFICEGHLRPEALL